MWSCLHDYICPVFPSVDIYFLFLSTFFQSIPSTYTFLGKAVLLCVVKQNPFCSFFSCVPSNIYSTHFFSLPEFFYLFPPGSINCNFFLSLFFTVITCIYFNLFLQVRSSKSGTILVVIPFILSNLNKCFFLVREPHNCCELQFWYNHCRHKFSHNTFI